MDDDTADSTVTLLEARLLRIEHLLFGTSAPATARPAGTSTADSLENLERRFNSLLSRFRVYAELLKVYKSHPSLFSSPGPGIPPTQLSPESLRATVLAFASAYPTTASALTAIADTPVPDPALSAFLIALVPRMEAALAVQDAQAAEVAALRARSERVVRAWHEGVMLRASEYVAEAEGRVEKVERDLRRAERLRSEPSDV